MNTLRTTEQASEGCRILHTGPPDLTAPSAQGSTCSVVSRAAVYPPHLLRAPHPGMGQVGRTSHSLLCLPSGGMDPGPATFQARGPCLTRPFLALKWAHKEDLLVNPRCFVRLSEEESSVSALVGFSSWHTPHRVSVSHSCLFEGF